jgi:putative methylase
VVTPAELAADLLFLALGEGDLDGGSVLDLGCGTGRLAVGAAMLGGAPVVGVDFDPESIALARSAMAPQAVEFVVGDVASWTRPAELVVMNPPFGAQRRQADRPFWDTAFRLAGRAIYAFALTDSREFIARRAQHAGAEIRATEPVTWDLKRTFTHHTRPSRTIMVDRWEIRAGRSD